MVKGQIELQHRRPWRIHCRDKPRSPCARLQRLKGQPLIAADLVNLVIVAQRQKILRICRVFVGRIKVDIALSGAAAFFVVLVSSVIRERLHDQRALGPIGIGIQPLDFREIPRRIIRAILRQLELATRENLFGR